MQTKFVKILDEKDNWRLIRVDRIIEVTCPHTRKNPEGLVITTLIYWNEENKVEAVDLHSSLKSVIAQLFPNEPEHLFDL